MFSAKNLAVLLAMLVSSNLTNAADCLKNICVGMNAITTENEVIKVTEIKDDKVVYQSGYYSKEISPDNLSKEVPRYQALTAGKTVLTAANEIAVVQMVFENGKAQYKIGYYTYVASDLSPEIEALGKLKAGTVVINVTNDLGKVLKVFQNNQVQYAVGYYTYIVPSTALTEEVSTFGDFQKETVLMTPSETIGSVESIFADGRIRYKVGYYTYTNLAQELSVQVAKVGELSRNTVVMNQGGEIGTVLSLFKNEKVQYQSGYYTYITKADTLSPKVSKVNGLSEGQTVIDTGNRIGTIKTLFADGRIQYSSGYYTFVDKNLVPEVDKLDAWRADAVAINQSNQVGAVKRMFKDDRIEFVAGYYTTVERKQDLSPEVENHPTYEKNKWYGTDSFRAGQIKRAFQNGKVQVQTTEDQLFVYAQLYPEVSDLQGIKADSEIAEVQFKKAKVLSVFENGTVLYEYKIRVTTNKPDEIKEKVVKASAKLFGVKGNTVTEEQTKTDTKAWLENLGHLLAISGDSFRSFMMASPSVIDFEKVAETKELLAKYLDKNPDSIADPALRKKVLQFLGEDSTDDNTVPGPTIPAGDSGTGHVIKINNANYLAQIDEVFKKKKLSYAVVDVVTRVPSLEIMILEKTNLVQTTCHLQYNYKPNMDMAWSGSQTRKVFSLFKKKNSCRNILKKFLQTLPL